MTPEELVEKYRSVSYDLDALSGLDDVDWSQLEHAHGEASDFPALIRAALSDIPRDSDFAFRLLHETIWHQGTIYQATAAAVPFIAALAGSAETAKGTDFAMLLATLAHGRGFFDRESFSEQDKEMWRRVLEKNGQDLEERIAEDKLWTKATQQAISDHLPVLYPYLEDDDEYVREYIADALSKLP